jgi:phage protein D
MPDIGISSVTSARPNFFINEKPAPQLAGGLFGLTIHETVSGLYRCEALFGNWGPKDGVTGFLYFDRATLEFGKRFKVRLGDTTLFDGRITALEARFPEATPPQIVVLAEDRLQDLRMTRRTRSFSDMSDSDVFAAIANEHGLTPQIDISGPPHKVLVQVNQSDLALLRDRARAVGAELWIEDHTLHAASRRARTAQPVQIAMNGRLREFSVIADLATQRSSVTASGWDVDGKQALSFEAGDSILSAELDGTLSGASVLTTAFGARKECVAHTVPATQQEVEATAEAWFRTQARRFVVGRGVADTDAGLRAGASVEIRGVGPLFEGKYYVAETRHRFDTAHGCRTEFTGERAGLGRP